MTSITAWVNIFTVSWFPIGCPDHSLHLNRHKSFSFQKIAQYIYPSIVICIFFGFQAVCTEAGMFALRERRVHVTQEDFEMAVAKVMKKETEKNMSLRKLWK